MFWICDAKFNQQCGRQFRDLSHLYINLACLFVCLYPINIKTAEPTGPKFFVGNHVTTGRFMNDQNFKYLSALKSSKSTKFFVKIRELFLFSFTMYTKRTCSQLIQEMGAKRPLRLERRARSALNFQYKQIERQIVWMDRGQKD